MPLSPDTPAEHASATAAGIRLAEKLGRAVEALEKIAKRGCQSKDFCGIFGDLCPPCEADRQLVELRRP